MTSKLSDSTVRMVGAGVPPGTTGALVGTLRVVGARLTLGRAEGRREGLRVLEGSAVGAAVGASVGSLLGS